MALLNKLFFPSSTSSIPQATSSYTPADVLSSSTSNLSTSSAAASGITQTTTTTAATSTSLAAAASLNGSSAANAATVTTATAAAAAAAAAASSATTTTSSSSSSSFNNKRINSSHSVHSTNYLSQFPFDGRQIRVLLYRECDSRGRRLLFDSNALQKVYLKDGSTTKSGASHIQQAKGAHQHSNGFIEVCDEYGYRHNRPNSTDITSVGEMVFGASALSYRGTALKVHWLHEPARILCSQVFLTPMAAATHGNGQTSSASPYSTISLNSLATPRTSISSEHGSMDGLSMSSFTMPFSVSVGGGGGGGRTMSLTPSERCSLMSSPPLDVPVDPATVSLMSATSSDMQSVRDGSESGPRYSSTYSTATDSGYSGISRSQMSSDQWSGTSYQYSTRSSLGSVISDQIGSGCDPIRKLSMDSFYFPTTNQQHASSWSSSLFDGHASDGSLQRRISRNLRTSFENEHSVNDFIGFISDNYAAASAAASTAGSNPSGGSEGVCLSAGGTANYRRASYTPNTETRSNPEIGRRRDAASMKTLTRRAKLGLAVCITMSESFEEEMELFCSEHIALLESMLSRLRAYTERAYINHRDFLQIMYQAWQGTQQWFYDLFTAPRIKCPVWLSITTSGSKYSKNVAERFVKELCWLLSFADTKDTNFFISTMLTAILTHHLGWVSTVSAFHAQSSSSAAAIEQRAKLLQVSQKHPYNALWAQMGDLYGAIACPPKLARTIIYGTEKLSVERLLNILTYFMRCGEVRRSAKREDFSKELVNSIVCQNNNETVKRTAAAHSRSAMQKQRLAGGTGATNTGTQNPQSGLLIGGGGGSGGLTRTLTCKQALSTMMTSEEVENGDDGAGNVANGSGSGSDQGGTSSGEEIDETELVRTLKKNEIPTVLAFRDSRFVQQELRIGNYLMDTGIEKNSLLQYQDQLRHHHQKDGRIRLTVTSPDNVETPMPDDECANDEGVMEAIEIDGMEDARGLEALKSLRTNRKNFLWNTVKEGLSLSDMEKLQSGCKLINRKLDHQQRSSSFSHNFDELDAMAAAAAAGSELGHTGRMRKRLSHVSLSDLITQNSMGKSDRMTWGIEPIKENISLEEQIHFDLCQKLIEREHGIFRTTEATTAAAGATTGDGQTDGGNSVLFVLGENEPLVNLRKSNEDLANVGGTTPAAGRDKLSQPVLCALHQRTHGPLGAKKHSGVKFNFEQYPQIATNYMKSKNLMISNYDLLMEKCSKLQENESNGDGGGGVPNINAGPAMTSVVVGVANECIVCNSSYQTPSNATELEFETDEMHRHNATDSNRPLPTVSSTASSIDTLKSLTNNRTDAAATTTTAGGGEMPTAVVGTVTTRKPTYSGNVRKVSSHRGSTSSVAAKCAAVNSETVHLLKLPVPGVRELPQDDEPPSDMKLRAGFIPSLFLNVGDHYVSDVVLQGTNASPSKWEMNLREDLALAAHSASLISLPTENIAIVADMEKWDVRLISSQSQYFPYAGGQSAPVGMSQLVSSMLETVQAMNNTGISAYECLSFLESKMQEIYLQSETLAAFLLETDFCPLSAVTTALNLSENDVPLLLSIASIHTPQISKKCGISFI